MCIHIIMCYNVFVHCCSHYNQFKMASTAAFTVLSASMTMWVVLIAHA